MSDGSKPRLDDAAVRALGQAVVKEFDFVVSFGHSPDNGILYAHAGRPVDDADKTRVTEFVGERHNGVEAQTYYVGGVQLA